MRCIVTGAAGFIGCHLVAMLRERGWDVGAVPHRWQWLLNVQGQYDVCFSLGWEGTHKADYDSLEQIENVDATLEAVELAHRNGCTHFIGLGSQAEYGPSFQPLTENSPLHPATMYGRAKLAAGILSEGLCKHLGIKHTWLRLLATYGPDGDDPEHLIPATIRRLMAGEKAIVYGGGQLHDYLYVTDVCEALIAVAEAETQGIYVLAGQWPWPVQQIAGYLAEAIVGDRQALEWREWAGMPLVGTSALMNVNHWRPRVLIRDGLDRTIAWYKAEVKQ